MKGETPHCFLEAYSSNSARLCTPLLATRRQRNEANFLLLTAAAVMAVLFAVAVGPALADHRFFRTHFDDQELESGDIDFDADISIRGDNDNQCAGVLQFGQSGNFSNQQGSSQYDNPELEQEFEGPEFDFSPENETECDQRVQQSSAASSFWGW